MSDNDDRYYWTGDGWYDSATNNYYRWIGDGWYDKTSDFYNKTNWTPEGGRNMWGPLLVGLARVTLFPLMLIIAMINGRREGAAEARQAEIEQYAYEIARDRFYYHE